MTTEIWTHADKAKLDEAAKTVVALEHKRSAALDAIAALIDPEGGEYAYYPRDIAQMLMDDAPKLAEVLRPYLPMNGFVLDAREKATMVAALEFWQRVKVLDPDRYDTADHSFIATNDGRFKALTAYEIDALIERVQAIHT